MEIRVDQGVRLVVVVEVLVITAGWDGVPDRLKRIAGETVNRLPSEFAESISSLAQSFETMKQKAVVFF